MKRFLILMFTSVMIFSLTSCNFATKTYKIELIVKGSSMEFWKNLSKGAQSAALTNHAEIQMDGPEEEKDPADQLRYIEKAIQEKPDAIILAASDYNRMVKPVENAVNAGIPVIMVDSDVNSKKTLAYVGTDNIMLGSKLAQSLESRVKTGGKVAVISFVQDSYPAVQREKGFRDTMARYSRFQLLKTQYGGSDNAISEKLTAALLKSEPDLVAIAALNEPSAAGAAQALSKSGRKNVRVFAVDCMPTEAMYMEQGVVDIALLQNPYQMGYYSVETAVKALNGQRVEDVYTDIYTVDKSNLFDKLYQQLIFPFSN
ncbi:MAG TPA: substrate-binding domain-containing protein [Clostridiales bacterium]|nr:substrate-binding domain-containing protein [Clostridiales bacterium]